MPFLVGINKMDIKVNENKSGEICLQFLKMSNSYKLFRSFVRNGISTTQDSSLRMVLSGLDKMLESPEMNESTNARGAASQAISGGDGGATQNAINNLGTKMDMLFKAVGAIQNNNTTVKAELDRDILDGFICRIEETIQGILNAKMNAIVGDQQLQPKVDALSKNIDGLKEMINKHSVACQAIKAAPVNIPSVIPPVEQPQPIAQALQAQAEQPVPIIAAQGKQAVACQDQLRYPSNNKKTRPACFGNFLEGKTIAETPCLGCVWVNECKIEKSAQAPQTPVVRPPCFKQHRHDLDCSVCPSDKDCLKASE